MRIKALNQLSLSVNKIFGKVPTDIARDAVLKPSIDGVRIRTIHVDFGKHRKVGVISILREGQNVSIAARLLTAKLIARKTKNGQSMITVV